MLRAALLLALAAAEQCANLDGDDDGQCLLQLRAGRSAVHYASAAHYASFQRFHYASADRRSADGQWGAKLAELQTAFANCSHVFLDLGSNIGVHVRMLFEGAHYPKSQMATKFFTQRFGDPAARNRPSAETGLCALGVEANPVHEKRLRALESCYAQKGWTAKFLTPVALTAQSNQVIDFFVEDDPGHSDWGASLSASPNAQKVSVPTLDISDVVNGVLHKIPNVKDVSAKMDIEGAEFEVVPRLEAAGDLCDGSISAVTIEWHDAKRFPALPKKYGDANMRDLPAKYSQDSRPDCAKPTTFLQVDDESYLLDKEYPLESVCPGS